ncbi:uncharacterized protein LOC132599500 isoform X2 [Lycium barbarum]|uniref:uncharacterized protein LOC132599500 isoform X2 n=1 Tax=Lycium barbarum TaxID=112863 RepID=UPI00293F4172|nr:uncharacterized protein LOC132599500 isoform X2 [Lycium barbarum]
MKGKRWKKKGKSFNQLNKKILLKKKEEAAKVKPSNVIHQAFLPIIDSAGVSAPAASPAPASSLGRSASQDKEKDKEAFKDLSGFIFLCSAGTKLDCFTYRVFGLRASKKETVEKIKPGTKLFLFDVDMKLLYGVYEATSTGKLDLEPHAFGGKFRAQVKYHKFKECLPLRESSLRDAIKDNYHGRKFEPELNGHQVRNLLSLFRPLPALATAAAVSHPLAKEGPSLANVGVPKIMPALAVEDQDVLSGFIFLCCGNTKPDCYRFRVFGLPLNRKEKIKKIKPGTKLFLFDFELKLLYGVYEATSTGIIDLEPLAFAGKFPVQVKFRIFKECLPLPEASFRHSIKDFWRHTKFEPELNDQQVRDLLSLFHPLPTSATAAPHPLAKVGQSFANVDMPKIMPALAMEDQAKVLSYPQPKVGSSLANVPPPNTIPALDMVKNSSMPTSAEDPYMARIQHVHPPPIVEYQQVYELQSAQHGWLRTTNFVETALTVTEHKQLTAPSHAYSHQPYVTQGISPDIQNPYLRYNSAQDVVPSQQYLMGLNDRNYQSYSQVEQGMLQPQESIVTHNYYSGPSAPYVPPPFPQQYASEAVIHTTTHDYYSGPSASYVPPPVPQQYASEAVIHTSTHDYCSGPSAPYVPPLVPQQYASEAVIQERTSSMSFEYSVVRRLG